MRDGGHVDFLVLSFFLPLFSIEYSRIAVTAQLEGVILYSDTPPPVGKAF